MRMLTANLESALVIAIREQGRIEKERNGPNFESGMVAGFREILKALRRRERITIEEN